MTEQMMMGGVIAAILAAVFAFAAWWRLRGKDDAAQQLMRLAEGQERRDAQNTEALRLLREDLARQAAQGREEQAAAATRQAAMLGTQLAQQGEALRGQLDSLHKLLREALSHQEARFETLREAVAGQLSQAQQEARLGREETANTLQRATASSNEQLGQFGKLLNEQLKQVGAQFSGQLTQLQQGNEQKLDQLRVTLNERLAAIQADNGQRLEAMRRTVDEKLHQTLEQRLGESFKLVSERLDQVHRGLGEMQTLAAGVGDLKKVLTNVKTRGTWGETQLAGLLEQLLTPEQYACNVATRPRSQDKVEFAIRLPGKQGDDTPVWLPLDAKFPLEDYQRLVDAQEQGDLDAIRESGNALEARLKLEARKIRDKYIEPPHTTDFAVLYLPVEGLYAEVLRRPGLADQLQRSWRVSLAGPTTLAAMLNSLQMGFRTLAIEKRSSEVWSVLGAVKTEFGKFGEVLEATHKKLTQAANSIDSAKVRTRQIERKLKSVEALPAADSTALLGAMPSLDEAE